MTIQLVVDNTDPDNDVGNILRAVHHVVAGEALPPDMLNLLLQIDVDDLESQLRQSIAGKALQGPHRTKPDLRNVG